MPTTCNGVNAFVVPIPVLPLIIKLLVRLVCPDTYKAYCKSGITPVVIPMPMCELTVEVPLTSNALRAIVVPTPTLELTIAVPITSKLFLGNIVPIPTLLLIVVIP